MPDSSTLLRGAIRAARSGERDKALDMLLDFVEQEPYSARAWIELSKLIDDPEDQVTALRNALAICPDDQRLANRLQSLRATHPFLALAERTIEQDLENDRLYYQAAQFNLSGVPGEAVRLLQQILESDPRNERAWLLLSMCVADPIEKSQALEKVISINPLNEDAWKRYENLRHVQSDPFKRALYLEERGDFDQAVQVYTAIITHSRSAVDRRNAQLNIDKLRTRKEADEIQPVDPNLNLFRLTAGPVMLFAIMIFIQSGLNLLHMPLLAAPGLFCVLAGSLLVSVTDMRPAHPRWVEIFGSPGTGDEPEMRQLMRLLGVVLLLAPYTMFLIEAGHRLGILQSSMLGHIP